MQVRILVDVRINVGEAAYVGPRLPGDVGVEPFDFELEVSPFAFGVTSVSEDCSDLFLAKVLAGYLSGFRRCTGVDEWDNSFDVDFVSFVAVSQTADGTEATDAFIQEKWPGESGVELAWGPNWVPKENILAW